MTPAEELANAKKKIQKIKDQKKNCESHYTRKVVFKVPTKFGLKRMELKLSQRDVARACGLSASVPAHIEAGTCPSVLTALQFAKFFGCRVEDLWSIDDMTDEMKEACNDSPT